MKFGVVLCPHCKAARGVRLKAKTGTCSKCGKKIDLSKARIICRVKTEKELALAVMEYNIKNTDFEDIYEEDKKLIKGKDGRIVSVGQKKSYNVYDEVASVLVRIRGKDEKVIAAANELCRHQMVFTENDLFEVLKRIGIKTPEDCQKYIVKLLSENVIYEPKTGIYKCLGGN
ncbi:MAG: hypothetical protein JSV56_11720 [Methanomassiliicoccales archaeon]|nr:MAG: hypothetical protein JSV56_11720 [Methanomassiliicoccales archaeon]